MNAARFRLNVFYALVFLPLLGFGLAAFISQIQTYHAISSLTGDNGPVRVHELARFTGQHPDSIKLALNGLREDSSRALSYLLLSMLGPVMGLGLVALYTRKRILKSLHAEGDAGVLSGTESTSRLGFESALSAAMNRALQPLLKKEWVPWRQLVEETIVARQDLLNEMQVEVVVEPCREIEVYIDRGLVKKVLGTLVSDAVRASAVGSTVTVKTVLITKERFVVEVRDVAQTPESSPLIAREIDDITKSLVEAHEGTLGVRAKPGFGHTVCFALNGWREESAEQSLPIPKRVVKPIKVEPLLQRY